jgi:hypothetical protein
LHDPTINVCFCTSDNCSSVPRKKGQTQSLLVGIKVYKEESIHDKPEGNGDNMNYKGTGCGSLHISNCELQSAQVNSRMTKLAHALALGNGCTENSEHQRAKRRLWASQNSFNNHALVGVVNGHRQVIQRPNDPLDVRMFIIGGSAAWQSRRVCLGSHTQVLVALLESLSPANKYLQTKKYSILCILVEIQEYIIWNPHHLYSPIQIHPPDHQYRTHGRQAQRVNHWC